MPAQVSMDTSWKGTKHLVPARNESRLLVRVSVNASNGIDVGGQHVRQGEHLVVIYASQLDEVKALVRTEDAKRALAMATETFAAQVAELVRGVPDGVDGDRERERRIAMHPHSVWSILAQDPRYKGGLGPIDDLTVVEEVPAPPTLENLQASGNDRLAAAILAAVGGSSGPSPEQLAAYIEAEVEKRVAAIEERLTRPASKKS